MNDVYSRVNQFLKKYPMTVAFRLRKHSKVLAKHLNDGEEILYIFPAQTQQSYFFSTAVVAFTNKRILIAQKRVIPGYFLNSITPDLFNDFQVFKGFIWAGCTIDTAKEVVNLYNLDSRAIVEIETNLSEYLINVKPKYKTKQD